MPEVQLQGSETVTPPDFRDIYGQVERIFTLAGTTELMSLGPTIVSRESGVEDGWLESEKGFKPNLRATLVAGLDFDVEGEAYQLASFFFKQGGNESAAKDWLGDIRFSRGKDVLEYTLHADGRIKLTKRNEESKWVSFCWAQEDEKTELYGALDYLKQQMHWRKLGGVSLSEQ